MERRSQEGALGDYLDELGLGGHCWFAGSDVALRKVLSVRFPDGALHTNTSESLGALDQCSVLILNLNKESPSSEQIFTQLMASSARPIIILLGANGLPNSEQERLRTLGYKLPPKQPKGYPFHVIEHAELGHKRHFDVARYWENRYISGRNSGSGSYGRLARFKAQYLNRFVKQNEVQSVIEFGCGDGAQLALAEYPEYIGLDISPTIIDRCRHIFAQDSSKRFETYDPEHFKSGSIGAELGLSLDVVYHLSNDRVYRAYLDHLFAASSRFVIIYSNSDEGIRAGVNEEAGYVRFRDVLTDIEQWQPEWLLVSATPNRFPFSVLNPTDTSFADFFVFEKQLGGKVKTPAPLTLESFSIQKIINSLTVSDENYKHLSEDVASTNKKIDALTDKIKQLDNAHRLQERLDKEHALYKEACQNISLLQAELDAANSKHYEAIFQYHYAHEKISSIQAELDAANAKYRDANAKYRTACQKLSALKSSQTYKAGIYINAASRSPVAAAKLPVRLWKLGKSRQKLSKQRTDLWQGLRYIKWKAVVPLATRLGVPYNKVASLSLPLGAKKLVQRPEPNTGASQTVERASQKQQPEAFTPPSSAVQEVSILGWPAPPNNSQPLVLAVMDEFTQSCFGGNLRLLQPRPDNWYGLAKKYPPELVFIESAWKGNGGSWQYRVGTYGIKPGKELEHMTAWARQEGIPSVFWNKEDPVHHTKFMEAAALVDHVFTTDQNMVESYKRRTGRQSVHALPFAAQPALHKPAPLNGRIGKSCFAGSWYGNRHAERGEAMKWLLKTAHKHGLDIFDRNHGTGNFPFPEEYREGIRGSLPYLELCKEYPRYRLFLNVNSVTDSPTMFSRRVFELMACGTPVVSTHARGIEEMFNSEAVWLVRSEAEADEAIQTLLSDDNEWRRRSLAGIREVFSGHTYAHRLNSVFETIGLTKRIETQPKLLLLARADHQTELEQLLAFADNQHYRQFQLLIECSFAPSAERLPEQVRLITDGNLSEQIKDGDDSAYAAVGWIAPHHSYGQFYLQDLTNAMTYQPEAGGWAKACGEDAFAFGAETRLSASIWRPEQFRERWLTARDHTLSAGNLYCADTEEFTRHTPLATAEDREHA